MKAKGLDLPQLELLLAPKDIDRRVREIGKELSAIYRHNDPIFIGVLNGAFMFTADLIRNVRFDCDVDFIKIGSYGQKSVSEGVVRLDKDVNISLEGRHVIVVEDIVDTGASAKFLSNHLDSHRPASMRFVTLLRKKHAKLDFEIEHTGFEIGREFVVGYGLDYGGRYRSLPGIYIYRPDKET